MATININKYDYLLCYCPLVGILFEVLRIVCAAKELSDIIIVIVHADKM